MCPDASCSVMFRSVMSCALPANLVGELGDCGWLVMVLPDVRGAKIGLDDELEGHICCDAGLCDVG